MGLDLVPDDKDRAILVILQDEGRIPLSELGRRIGLSQPAVSERVKRLEEAGIITGYGARIDPRALNLGLTAIMRLRTTHDQIAACLKLFAARPEIVEVHRVTGEDCFVLKAIVPRPEDLAPLVDAIGPFGPVNTAVVLKSEAPKPLGRALLAAGRRAG